LHMQAIQIPKSRKDKTLITFYVDDVDADFVKKHTWKLESRHHQPVGTKNSEFPRVPLWRALLGVKEKDKRVVYINGNRLDNTRKNLKLVTRAESIRLQLASRKEGPLWTEKDVLLLKELIMSPDGVKKIIEKTGRPAHLVLWKARKLGFSRQLLLHEWAPKEEELVREKYPKVGAERLAHLLGVSAQAVTAKARQLGVQRLRAGEYSAHFTGHKGIGRTYWYSVTKGAKIRNLIFGITIEWAWDLYERQGGKCALSGLPITPPTTRKPGTASLDRIDSSQGYLEGNVQWVHKTVNKMKSNMSEEEFLTYCKAIVTHNKLDTPSQGLENIGI